MESYKRLDNLCKDLLSSERGVSAYISEMDRCQSTSHSVAIENWQQDYIRLKSYRHIRNQIAHVNYASEESMTSENDVHWIENFYQRIIDQTDPLALYYQSGSFKLQERHMQVTSLSDFPAKISPQKLSSCDSQPPIGCALLCVIMLLIILFVSFHI